MHPKLELTVELLILISFKSRYYYLIMENNDNIDTLKEQGNEYYKSKNYDQAIECYTIVINNIQSNQSITINEKESNHNEDNIEQLDTIKEINNNIIIDNNHNDTLLKCLMNRSLCYAQLEKYMESNRDAIDVIKLQKNHLKAYYRLIKNCFILKKYKDLRITILNGIKACGNYYITIYYYYNYYIIMQLYSIIMYYNIMHHNIYYIYLRI